MTTVFAGDVVEASDYNELEGGTLGAPICQLVQQSGATQSGWTSATNNAITFGVGSETVDTHNAHDTGSNTSRIVIGVKLGWWLVEGVYVSPGNSATTTVRAMIAKNGSVVVGSCQAIQPASTTVINALSTRSVLVEATSASDYVEVHGYQIAASGTIGTGFLAYLASSLSATWQRPS